LIQKSWDQHHLKGIFLGYSQNFESHHLHVQIIFYSISKFIGTIKITGHFKNKNSHGPDLPEMGQNGQIQPRSATPHAAAAPFKPASGAWPSVALGYRIGMRRSWPSDQVAIDGQRSSSSR
jgi:hypothetical protein